MTADGDCSHEIKKMLTPWEKSMTNLDSILKSRYTALSTKVHLVKVMVFPVVMYGCEIWTIKKAECWRIDAFELWCWRRLLRVPWTSRRSNQSILRETSPDYSAEGLMLKLKLQYFGHLMRRADSLEKALMLWKIEGRRRMGRQKMRWLDGITDSWTWVGVNSGSQWWTGKSGVLQSMGLQRVKHNWATELNWKCINLHLPGKVRYIYFEYVVFYTTIRLIRSLLFGLTIIFKFIKLKLKILNLHSSLGLINIGNQSNHLFLNKADYINYL